VQRYGQGGTRRKTVANLMTSRNIDSLNMVRKGKGGKKREMNTKRCSQLVRGGGLEDVFVVDGNEDAQKG